MTSSHRGLYVRGQTRDTMAGTKGRKRVRGSQSQKASLSWDGRRQLACMNAESLVIAHQRGAVNTFPGLVRTARQVTKVGYTRSRWANPERGGRCRRCCR